MHIWYKPQTTHMQISDNTCANIMQILNESCISLISIRCNSRTNLGRISFQPFAGFLWIIFTCYTNLIRAMYRSYTNHVLILHKACARPIHTKVIQASPLIFFKSYTKLTHIFNKSDEHLRKKYYTNPMQPQYKSDAIRRQTLSKTPAAGHRRTPKKPPQAICAYCVSIFMCSTTYVCWDKCKKIMQQSHTEMLFFSNC